MKRFSDWLPNFLISLALLQAAACATTPRIDWGARVGSYTYDQAIVEFGPPDKSAKLKDGTLVGEWMTRRGYKSGTIHGFYGSYGIHHFDEMPSPDQYLRLTFDPENKLKEWKYLWK
jgi:hypothetical protein